ncbi:disintegrin and metalloproteinase domain-containing protein 12-like [Tachypleus tridentatus]|uniref:disintegrin and metalloproteinase domain-containing protein 12-like n=1 Tax=Tachypleus tridentatus TaxID=6853 RepID=UPI003FD0C82E
MATLYKGLIGDRNYFVLLCRLVFVFLCMFVIKNCAILLNDPKLEFYHYEIAYPRVFSTDGREKREIRSKDDHEKVLMVDFQTTKKRFLLELRMNQLLLPSHYFEKHHKNGFYVLEKPMKEKQTHCHYHGNLKGNYKSWAAVSTCHGISGVVHDGKDLYYLHPESNAVNSSHLILNDSHRKFNNFKCGFNDSKHHDVKARVLHKLNRHRRSAVLHESYKSNSQSRYVELVIVNDNREFNEMKKDKDLVFERSKEIANIVSGLYLPLNIYIALVGVIVWSEHDEIALSSDGDTTLTNFLHYRRERLVRDHPNDNAQLVTGMAFDGGVVGKALKGPICTYQYSGGVNMDHSQLVGVVATTVAHELGHNFGMEHDTSECQCPDDKCIMASASSSLNPRHWSSCSLEYLHLAYDQGMDYCLQNHPTKIIGPVCGNGYLEDGEECDCGIEQFCDNPCCNATTCELFSNATCATGFCCDTTTCQIKVQATICRNAMSECDLPEFCDGKSEFCPDDVQVQFGTECGDGKAYCYNGHCRSHADQCKLLWGPSGKMSDNRCFQQNVKGNVNGNCGFQRINQSYTACQPEDIMCGMLHCVHLNERLEFGMESAAVLARSFFNVRGKILTCRSAIVDLGLTSTDPGLAPDGAKCGENKLCVNQKCVSIQEVENVQCPYDCNGHGICNSRHNCHCEVGYAPPFCDYPGVGGSVDSGPASVLNSNYDFMIAMYIIFLCIIPIGAITGIAVFYFRRHLNTWWIAKARKAAIRSRAKQAAERKSRPLSKFTFDQPGDIRSLEISAPIPQEGKAPAVTTLPRQISAPIPQSTTSNLPAQAVPVRPAPPRPEASTHRSPSWAPSSCTDAFHVSSVARTSSTRSKGNARPMSIPAARPNIPPPRPPPPQVGKTCSSPQDKLQRSQSANSPPTSLIKSSGININSATCKTSSNLQNLAPGSTTISDPTLISASNPVVKNNLESNINLKVVTQPKSLNKTNPPITKQPDFTKPSNLQTSSGQSRLEKFSAPLFGRFLGGSQKASLDTNNFDSPGQKKFPETKLGTLNSNISEQPEMENVYEEPPSPNSLYYDDCQNTLDFSDTPLAFVHQSLDSNPTTSQPQSVMTSSPTTTFIQSKPQFTSTTASVGDGKCNLPSHPTNTKLNTAEVRGPFGGSVFNKRKSDTTNTDVRTPLGSKISNLSSVNPQRASSNITNNSIQLADSASKAKTSSPVKSVRKVRSSVGDTRPQTSSHATPIRSFSTTSGQPSKVASLAQKFENSTTKKQGNSPLHGPPKLKNRFQNQTNPKI